MQGNGNFKPLLQLPAVYKSSCKSSISSLPYVFSPLVREGAKTLEERTYPGFHGLPWLHLDAIAREAMIYYTLCLGAFHIHGSTIISMVEIFLSTIILELHF